MKSPEQWSPGCKSHKGEETHTGTAGQITAPSEGGGWPGSLVSQWGHHRMGPHHRRQQEPSQGGLGRDVCHPSPACVQEHGNGQAPRATGAAGASRDNSAPGSAPIVTSSRCRYPEPWLLDQASRRVSSQPPVACMCTSQHPRSPGGGHRAGLRPPTQSSAKVGTSRGCAAQPDSHPPSHAA